MAQSTPTNSYCSRASFRCAYMHHIEKYVFQQKFCAPGLGLLLDSRIYIRKRRRRSIIKEATNSEHPRAGAVFFWGAAADFLPQAKVVDFVTTLSQEFLQSE